ncbi:MAG: helix-turn-helix transcriptional regulator [Candidatus Sumerlaeaceae bacterium]
MRIGHHGEHRMAPHACPAALTRWCESQTQSIEVWDSKGYCVMVNAAWRALWRMPAKVLIGSGYNILTDQQLHAKPVWLALRLGFAGHTSVYADTPLSHYDPRREDGRPGRTRLTEGCVVPVWTGNDQTDERGPAFTIIMLNDVTDAAKRRLKMQRAAESLQSMFLKEVHSAAITTPWARLLRAPQPQEDTLTCVEAQAVFLLSLGCTVKDIAGALQKSEKTVYVQLQSSCRKLGLISIAELTVYSCRWQHVLGAAGIRGSVEASYSILRNTHKL